MYILFIFNYSICDLILLYCTPITNQLKNRRFHQDYDRRYGQFENVSNLKSKWWLMIVLSFKLEKTFAPRGSWWYKLKMSQCVSVFIGQVWKAEHCKRLRNLTFMSTFDTAVLYDRHYRLFSYETFIWKNMIIMKIVGLLNCCNA